MLQQCWVIQFARQYAVGCQPTRKPTLAADCAAETASPLGRHEADLGWGARQTAAALVIRRLEQTRCGFLQRSIRQSQSRLQKPLRSPESKRH